MTTLNLTWVLRRSADPRAAAVTCLAYALVTALLTVTVAGAHAFFSWRDADAGVYQGLAAFALVLLLTPLLYLGAAAARLSARAQDRRLSTLRLLGATGGQVAGVTVLGAAAEATLGALAGIAASLAVTPLVGLVSFRGAALGGALWMPVWAYLSLLLGTALIASISAVAGLRRVLVTPLGVRTRAARPVPGWARLAVAAVLFLAGIAATRSGSVVQGVWGIAGLVAVVLGSFAAALVALNALGPWVLKVWARRRARTATDAAGLLSARTVLDDTAATWRQVSGAAMAGIVAVVGGSGAALARSVPDDAAESDRLLGADILTGVVVTLVIAFVGVAGTALVSQAATVLDREELAASLEAVGVPRGVTTAARVGALVRPLVVVLLVAILVSLGMLLPFAAMSVLLSPLTVGIVAVVCVAGVASVWGAAVAAGRVGRRAGADARPLPVA